jgi:hypothetical protein
MGSPPARFPDDSGKLGLLPATDGFLVSFPRSALRFLGCPAKPLTKELPHMIVVKQDAEVPVDQLRDPGGRPQAIDPAVGDGSLKQQGFELLELVSTQVRRTVRVGHRGQAVGGLIGTLSPTIDGRTSHTQTAGDDDSGFALVEKFNAPTPPAFEFFGCSNRSTHGKLDAPSRKMVHWLRSCQ